MYPRHPHPREVTGGALRTQPESQRRSTPDLASWIDSSISQKEKSNTCHLINKTIKPYFK